MCARDAPGAGDKTRPRFFVCLTLAELGVLRFACFRRSVKAPSRLELAVAARCEAIVTYNVRDFAEAQKFGVSVLEPAPFLSRVGVLK